jgi:hypothetical protein
MDLSMDALSRVRGPMLAAGLFQSWLYMRIEG